ncbi:conserved hypothetical protein [Ricinus communis]|uniref:Reverse transcriptase domain-containing protein n=1 Tax=Ricinus communis TaxID=3988 RepID=B9SDS5_RICCO|nr:conserved hypothetical protein [Ricinus communis]
MNISDNIIIAQEVVHSMKLNGKVGWMPIKIDLEKAYDRLRWSFIRNTLEDIGLLGLLIDRITLVLILVPLKSYGMVNCLMLSFLQEGFTKAIPFRCICLSCV